VSWNQTRKMIEDRSEGPPEQCPACGEESLHLHLHNNEAGEHHCAQCGFHKPWAASRGEASSPHATIGAQQATPQHGEFHPGSPGKSRGTK
jgi:predicted RNA-binding Zn-ribbon protein involved in translation (DUF1610 family)